MVPFTLSGRTKVAPDNLCAQGATHTSRKKREKKKAIKALIFIGYSYLREEVAPTLIRKEKNIYANQQVNPEATPLSCRT